MEQLTSPETRQPENLIVLNGNQHQILIIGQTARDYSYDSQGMSVEQLVLSGQGCITVPPRSSRSFSFHPISQSRYNLDNYKPENLSEVFKRNDVVDQAAYADAIAKHMLEIADSLDKAEVYTKNPEDPIWVDQQSGSIEINLEAYLPALEKYLFSESFITKASGHLKLEPWQRAIG